MKSQLLPPAAAAVIGFAVAWAVKPDAEPAKPNPAGSENAGAKSPPRNDNARPRPRAVTEQRPKEVKAGDFPLGDLAEQGPQTRTEAKMLRLTEALDLSIDQQGAIIQAVEDARNAVNESAPVIQDMAARGRAIEQALAKTLSPEQLAKFEELRVRERENRVESRAQKILTQLMDEVDLSPGQRDEVLSRLRQYGKEQMQAIPAAATLLLNTSLLPTDSKDLTVDGLLALQRIGEEPPPPDNPQEAHERVINRQRQELEEQLRCFDGVLTAGQMGQVHAALAEKRRNLEELRKARPRENTPAPTPPQDPIPDDESDLEE